MPSIDFDYRSRKASRRRKKMPKFLALIDKDICTGCESCREVCPVDCITKIEPSDADSGSCPTGYCEVDWNECIGCKLCIRVPGKKSDPHLLSVCPWGGITMVPSSLAGNRE